MEPKYYAFRRWLDTPIISWEYDGWCLGIFSEFPNMLKLSNILQKCDVQTVEAKRWLLGLEQVLEGRDDVDLNLFENIRLSYIAPRTQMTLGLLGSSALFWGVDLQK